MTAVELNSAVASGAVYQVRIPDGARTVGYLDSTAQALVRNTPRPEQVLQMIELDHVAQQVVGDTVEPGQSLRLALVSDGKVTHTTEWFDTGTPDAGWSTAGVVAAVLGGLVLLSIVGAVIGFVTDWGHEARRVVSPQNVTQQYDLVISDWQDMQAAADNACQVQTARRDSADPTFVEDPAVAYAATYRRTAADYNSRQQNIFKAGKVGPHGYPKVAPLPGVDQKTHVTDWCSQSDQLRTIHP